MFFGLKISTHALFEALAYAAGFRYFLFLRKRQTDPFSSEERAWIFVGAVVGAFVFSRLIAALENPAALTEGRPLLYFIANKTIVGGLLGGWIGVEAVKKVLGLHRSSGDLMTYPLILGMIIGRIGCFFGGLEDGTYGIETRLPWGVDFGDGLHRHPTQLYEAAFLILLWTGLWRLERNGCLEDGYRFKLFMTAYLAFRVAIEFLKPVHPLALGLSAIQIASLMGLIYCGGFFVWHRATTSTTT